ncbi:AAA family ATPase [Croceibacterium sp. TMG7-5b_MA50]|uniref:GumC family protein n=1 Tax=Croceibacterium sp. TMG7-5b_MA50 TaxID=3121290 RepID=UPI0032221035
MATQSIDNTAAERPRRGGGRTVAGVIGGLGSALRRRWRLVLGVAAAIFIAALVAITLMRSDYQATARIRVDPTLNPMEQEGAQSLLNAEAIETETGLMSSRALAEAVVRDLELYRDPEFAGDDALQAGEPSADLVSRTVNAVRRKTAIGRDQLSYIISLSFTAKDAEKAARIANAMVETYIDLRVQSSSGSSERQAEFFRARLGELAGQVNAAESRLADYRASTGLPQTSEIGTVADQQIATLSGQLAAAEADAAAARSNASVASQQLSGGNVDAVAAVQGSNVIRDLRAQRATILRERDEIETRYDSRHPEAIRVRDQLAGIDRQILDEGQRVVTSLQAQARAADAEVGALRSRMGALEGQRASNTRNTADAERLERDAASARAQYDRMNELSLESTQSTGAAIAQVEVVDSAQPPVSADGPPRSVLLALAAIVALAGGIGSALAVEMAQGGLRTTGDMEEVLGLRLLASLPFVGKRPGRWHQRTGPDPADTISAGTATLYTEAVRNLRASISRAGGGRGKVVGFTSAIPGEAKTETALSYARLLAVNSASVLLIDCDLRNGRLSRRLPHRPEHGLVELLNGEATFDGIVSADKGSDLAILPVAAAHFTSQDLFDGDAMEQLLTLARQRYDYVVLDLPPVLAVADARTIARHADGVCVVIRWGHTKPAATMQAVDQLHDDGVNVLGGAFTMVDPDAEVMAGGYFTGALYRRYFA